MNYSEQILKARFEQLPKDIKEAIIATPWKDKLAQIAGKHKLHIDQADNLSKETIIIMFGLDHPDNLVYNIVKNVDVSEEKAEAIAEDLNREIFLKIRESLKGIFKEREEEEKSESSPLGETKDKENKTETEEMPSREDILKEIEDKEHHKLPMLNKSELHLEVQLPSEIKVFEKPAVLPNQNTADDAKAEMEKSEKINSFLNRSESERERKIFEKVNSKADLETKHPSNMNGVVNVNAPKETIKISDTVTPPKAKQPDASGKLDPYRERIVR